MNPCSAGVSPASFTRRRWKVPARRRRYTTERTALACALCLAAGQVSADWSGTLYGYGEASRLRGDSVLNPDNRIAGLAEQRATAEGRFDFKAQRGDLHLSLRPIVLFRGDTDAGQARGETWLSQGVARWRVNDAFSLSAGRELLNWGPAQFRSPSSPFYFANGRSDPLRELSGLDAVKFTWTPDLATAVSLVRITGSGHAARQNWNDTWLMKADHRGEDWAAGLALAKTPGQATFLGLHGQYTASDALLIYGEFGSGSVSGSRALLSPADASEPFQVAARSSRQADVSLGLAYTWENGHSFNAEILHSGHGYHRAEAAAYFARAAASPAAAAQALADAPPLLGRDYLHLVWQSNLMESGGESGAYWRLMASHSLSDHGSELAGYGEHAFDSHTSGFVMVVLPVGDAREEFSSLMRGRITLGLKMALP